MAGLTDEEQRRVAGSSVPDLSTDAGRRAAAGDFAASTAAGAGAGPASVSGLNAFENVGTGAGSVGLPYKQDVETLKERCLKYLAEYKEGMETLQLIREKTNKEYMAEPYGNEVDGRSKVVMSDVFDTIEWLKPLLMRIFYGGADVVKIDPVGKEDTQGAKLLNEKVNFDLQKGLNGYLLLQDWFDDALKFKIGVVKYWWERKTEYKKTTYKDIDEQAYLELSNNPDFEIESVKPGQAAGQSMMMEPSPTYTVTGQKRKLISKPMAEVIPPEEFIGNTTAIDFKKEDFVAHWKRKHIAEIAEEYGVTQEELRSDADLMTDANSSFYFQRFKDLGGVHFIRDESDRDYYYLYECFVNDYGSGKKQPMKMVLCGDRILKLEENSYGRPPFCTLSPIRLAHRAIGRSVAELVQDIQKYKTALVRAISDNIYYQNNGVAIINPWKINADDLLNNNYPGGRVRTLEAEVNISECYRPMDIRPLAPWTFQMLEWIDTVKENRTGVTKYNQGSDADSLNKTASGISQIMSASMQRSDLVARNFAETGVRDLFTAFAQMNIDYGDESVDIRLNEEWKQIRRQEIDVNFDISISAGLGTGTRETTVQQMGQMLVTSLNPELMQAGIVTPENVYNVLLTLYENLGRKDAERFVTDPKIQQQAQQAQQEANAQNQGIMGSAQTSAGAGQAGAVGAGAPPAGQPDLARLLGGNTGQVV